MAAVATGTQSQDQSRVETKILYAILFRRVDVDVPFENWLIRAKDVEDARRKLINKLSELPWIDHSKTVKGQFESQVSIFSAEKGVRMDLNIVPSGFKLIL